MGTLSQRDLAVFWHPCSRMADHHDFPPLEVVGARGARLLLADGSEVLDAIASWWCKSLGHGHAGVRARIERQLASFEHVITANTTNGPLVELCERLLLLANGATPAAWGPRAPNIARLGLDADTVMQADANSHSSGGPFRKVFLADNGSTAVEVALKMALQSQAQRGQVVRTGFAALAGGYHGETVGALSVGDLGLYADPYRALMFPVTKIQPIPHRFGPDDADWMDANAEWPAIEATLKPVAASLAAVIYEPVLQAAGGMRFYSPDLLRRLRSFADQHGIYLIADEIAAGMGRLGTMLAGELAGVWPDFVVLSKGLTAGFLPLSAVLTTDEIHRDFDGDWASHRAFLHSNTYTGNALGIAAALGALDAYASEGVLENVATVGRAMRAALADVMRGQAALTRLRGLGMVAAVDLRAPDGDPFDPAARTGLRVSRQAIKRGALLRPLGDTLYLFPPLNATTADVHAMADILGASVADVVNARP